MGKRPHGMGGLGDTRATEPRRLSFCPGAMALGEDLSLSEPLLVADVTAKRLRQKVKGYDRQTLNNLRSQSDYEIFLNVISGKLVSIIVPFISEAGLRERIP